MTSWISFSSGEVPGSSATLRSMSFLTLFSWPEYVWIAYHRASSTMDSSREEINDLVQDPTDGGIHDPDDQRDDDDEDDDDEGRVPELRNIRPGDLLDL